MRFGSRLYNSCPINFCGVFACNLCSLLECITDKVLHGCSNKKIFDVFSRCGLFTVPIATLTEQHTLNVAVCRGIFRCELSVCDILDTRKTDLMYFAQQSSLEQMNYLIIPLKSLPQVFKGCHRLASSWC